MHAGALAAGAAATTDSGQPLVAAYRGHPVALHLDQMAESIRRLVDEQFASSLAEQSPAVAGRS